MYCVVALRQTLEFTHQALVNDVPQVNTLHTHQQLCVRSRQTTHKTTGKAQLLPWTNRHLKNYVRQPMTNSLIKLFSIPVIHCTPCCHRAFRSIPTLQPQAAHCLPQHDAHLCDCNFLTRMLYKDSY